MCVTECCRAWQNWTTHLNAASKAASAVLNEPVMLNSDEYCGLEAGSKASTSAVNDDDAEALIMCSVSHAALSVRTTTS